LKVPLNYLQALKILIHKLYLLSFSKANVDIIVVFMHWGEELIRGPLPYQLHITRHLMSLGVQVIIGSHPHVLQPHWMTNDKKLVAYSLGNFLFPPMRPAGGNMPVKQFSLRIPSEQNLAIK